MISPIFEDFSTSTEGGELAFSCTEQQSRTIFISTSDFNELIFKKVSRKKIKLKKQRKSDLDQKEKNLQTNQFILSIRFFGSKHKHTLGGWSSEDVGFGFLHCFLFPYSPKIQAIFHVIWFVLASGKNLLLLSSTKQLQCKKEKRKREKRNNNMRNLNSQWSNTT